MTSMALRPLDSGDTAVLREEFGIQKIVLGAVNYGLVIAIKVEEFKKNFDNKVESLIMLDCVSGTFDLVGCTCDKAAIFDPGKRIFPVVQFFSQSAQY